MIPTDLRDVILPVLHAGHADAGWPTDWEGECRWCGRTDGDVLVLVHESGTDTGHRHTECAEHGYAPTPPCTGAPDLCGAAAGEPCRPGCPSLAADPS